MYIYITLYFVKGKRAGGERHILMRYFTKLIFERDLANLLMKGLEEHMFRNPFTIYYFL